MTRIQGFIGGLVLWSLPVAMWWKVGSMVGPEDVITRSGEPISPLVSQGIGALIFGFGIWGIYKVLTWMDDLKFWDRVVLCGLFVAFFGATGSGAFAIANAQSYLLSTTVSE